MGPILLHGIIMDIISTNSNECFVMGLINFFKDVFPSHMKIEAEFLLIRSR